MSHLFPVIVNSIVCFCLFQRDMPFCTQIGKIDFCENPNQPAGGLLDRGCNVDDYMKSLDLWTLVQNFKKESACQQDGCPTACNNIFQGEILMFEKHLAGTQDCKKFCRLTPTLHFQCAATKDAHKCLKPIDIRYFLIKYFTSNANPEDYRAFGRKLRTCYMSDPLDKIDFSCCT